MGIEWALSGSRVDPEPKSKVHGLHFPYCETAFSVLQLAISRQSQFFWKIPFNSHSMPTQCPTQNPTRELHLGAHSGTPLGVPLGSSTQEPGAHSGILLGRPLGNPSGAHSGIPLGNLTREPTGAPTEPPFYLLVQPPAEPELRPLRFGFSLGPIFWGLALPPDVPSNRR